MPTVEIRPQPGPQWQAAASKAQIVITGGAAGGGKSFGELLCAARHINDPTYNAIVFRRKYTEIMLPGALWDTAKVLYTKIGSVPIRGRAEFIWDGGGKIKLAHLNEEKNVHDHQGAQYAFIGMDELTEFTFYQFNYILTRNRPPDGCKVAPRMYCTCNPDADSWVASFIQWWWDPDTGYPIPERSGVVRYFHVIDDKIVEWVDETWRDEDGNPPISATFIPSFLEDNPILMEKDPTYRSRLSSRDRVTRERLLKGNWRITYSGGMFDPSWFGIVDEVPKGMRLVRYWDFAATEQSKEKKNDPDWTAGALCGVYDDTLYILDVEAFRETPGKAEKKILECANQDGYETEIWWEEEKGASGKWSSEYLNKVFKGYECHIDPVVGKKEERAKPWAAWAEFGRVRLLRGAWNRRFLGRVGKFPEGKKDEIDAVSGAFKALVGQKKVLPYYIPNSSYHLVSFAREKEDFDKIQPHNVEVLVALWTDKAGGVYGGCYVWAVQKKRLRLFNEIYLPNATVMDVAYAIKEKVVVPLEQKSGWVTVSKIIGNDEFFNIKEKSLSKDLRKQGIKVHQVVSYDESTAIYRLNNMFSSNQIICHAECIESDIQWRSWLREEGKDGKPEKGQPLARTLCLVACELHSTGRLIEYKQPKAYSFQKRMIGERLKNVGLTQSMMQTNKIDKQYDYLTR